jgi:DNA-binding transcriptional MerR regulator
VSPRNLSPSQAASRLRVSAKALRLYEQRGLIAPQRTAAGWRAYGPAEMARAHEIVSLRSLGLSLAQVARVLEGDPSDLEAGLSAHEVRLQTQAQQIANRLEGATHPVRSRGWPGARSGGLGPCDGGQRPPHCCL